MKKRNLATVLCALSATASGSTLAAELELYVDRKTKQIFAEPAPGRDKLGKFVQVDENGKLPASAMPAAPALPPPLRHRRLPTLPLPRPHLHPYRLRHRPRLARPARSGTTS